VAAPHIAGLPPFFTLTQGMAVRLTALDPTDGSEVSGVILSNMALSVDQEDADLAPPKDLPVTLVAGQFI
jgi:hypothetical protein